MKSILQEEKYCYICGSPYVERHHVYKGSGNRQLSEKYGLVCYLCPEHHRGSSGAHFNKALDDELQRWARDRFEQEYPWDFRRLFYGDGQEVLRDE